VSYYYDLKNLQSYLFIKFLLLESKPNNSKILAACKVIENEISTDSQVFYAPDLKYYDSIRHFVINTIALSACSVEPSTTADIAVIVNKLNIYIIQ
jgi:hypothetical protein